MLTVLEAQVPVPIDVVLSYNVTVRPVSQEIMKVGVVSLVILSVVEEPLSVPVVMSGVPVAPGFVTSMVIERLLDAAELLPARSVCLAFMVACVPSVNAEEVIVIVLDAQVPVPIDVTLS